MLEGRSNTQLPLMLLLLVMLPFLPKTSAGWRSELVGVGAVLGLPADDADTDADADAVDEDEFVVEVDSEQRAPEPPFAEAELAVSSEDVVDADAIDAIFEGASRAASLTSIAPDRKPTGAVEEDGAVVENPP